MKLDLNQITAVAFDFDGTLTDSYPTHTKARLMAFADHGLNHIPEKAHTLGHTYGNTVHTIIAGVLKAAGTIPVDADPHTHPLVKELVETKNQKFRELCENGLDAQPGAIDLFRVMVTKYPGKVAIVTTAPESEVKLFLNRYGLEEIINPELLIGEGTIIKLGLMPKPASDAFKLAAERMGVLPEQMFVIEDSPGGVIAAKKAGAVVLAVGTTNMRKAFYAAELQEHPDYFIQKFTDLAEI